MIHIVWMCFRNCVSEDEGCEEQRKSVSSEGSLDLNIDTQ